MKSKNILFTLLASTILASCGDKPSGETAAKSTKNPIWAIIPQMNIYSLKETSTTSVSLFEKPEDYLLGLSEQYKVDRNPLSNPLQKQMELLETHALIGLNTTKPVTTFEFDKMFGLILKENQKFKVENRDLIHIPVILMKSGSEISFSADNKKLMIGNLISNNGSIDMSAQEISLDSGYITNTKITVNGNGTFSFIKINSGDFEGLSNQYFIIGKHSTLDMTNRHNTRTAFKGNILLPPKQTLEVDGGELLLRPKTEAAEKAKIEGSTSAPTSVDAVVDLKRSLSIGGTLNLNNNGLIRGNILLYTGGEESPCVNISSGVVDGYVYNVDGIINLTQGEIKNDVLNATSVDVPNPRQFFMKGGKISGNLDNRNGEFKFFDENNGEITGTLTSKKTGMAEDERADNGISTFSFMTGKTLTTGGLEFKPATIIKFILTDKSQDTLIKTTDTVDMQNIALSLLAENEAIINPTTITLITTTGGKVQNLNTDLVFDPSLKVAGKAATADDIEIKIQDDNKLVLRIINPIDAGPKKPKDDSAPYIASSSLRDFEHCAYQTADDIKIGDLKVSMIEADQSYKTSFKFNSLSGFAQYSTTKNQVQELSLSQVFKNSFFGISNTLFYGLNTAETSINTNQISMNSKLMAAQTKIFKQFDFNGLSFTPGFVTGYTYTIDDKSTYNMSDIKTDQGSGFFGATFNISKNFSSKLFSYTAFAKIATLSHINSHEISFGSKTQTVKGKNTFYTIGANAKLDDNAKACAFMEVDAYNNQKYEFSINLKL